MKYIVVLINNGAQKFFAAFVHCVCFKTFILNFAYGILFFVCGKRKYRGNFQRFFRSFLKFLECLVIKLCGFNAAYCKHSIKTALIAGKPVRFLPEFIEYVLCYFFYALRMQQGFLVFCGRQFFFVLL